MFVIDFETPPGSNLAYTRAKAQEAARIARKQPEVAYTYTSVAAQGDAVDEGTRVREADAQGQPRSRTQAQVVADIRRELQTLTGITASISVGFNPGEKQIQLQVRGAGCARADAGGRGRGGRDAAGARGRGRRARPPRARSRSWTSRWTAAWRARWASRWARWRRRCGRRLPASTSATGSTRRARRATSRCASRRSRALSWPTSNRCRSSSAGPKGVTSVPLGQVARVTPVDRPRAHRSPEPRPRGQRGGQHPGPPALGGRGRRAWRGSRPECDVPRGLCPEPGRRIARTRRRSSRADVHRPRRRRDADVLRAGGAVRVVPRAAGDHAVAAAVAHRRDAGAARHRQAARDHEHDRRHPAGGHRGQERDPADRLREVVRGGRSGPARGADPRRAACGCGRF